MEGAVDRGEKRLVLRGEEVAAPEKRFDPADAGVRGKDVGVLGVGLVVAAALERAHDGGQAGGVDAARAGRPGDDERDARLVDEDGVGLVDEGRGEGAVDELAGLVGQAVAQVVEAGLLGRGVGHIAGIGRPLGRLVHALLGGADGEAEKPVSGAHPGRVASGQVVVEGQDVDGTAGEGEGRGREHGRERLALSGRELGDLAVGHGQGGDDLDVVGVEARRAARGLEDEGEGFDPRVLLPARLLRLRPRRRAGEAPAQGGGEAGDLRVGGADEPLLLMERPDLGDDPRVRGDVRFDGMSAEPVEGRFRKSASCGSSSARHVVSRRDAEKWRRSARRASEKGRAASARDDSLRETGLAARPDGEENAENKGAEDEGQRQEEDGQDQERDDKPGGHLLLPRTYSMPPSTPVKWGQTTRQTYR